MESQHKAHEQPTKRRYFYPDLPQDLLAILVYEYRIAFVT
jgi:hypothetical protein